MVLTLKGGFPGNAAGNSVWVMRVGNAKEGVGQDGGGGAHWRIPENNLVRRSVLQLILVSTQSKVYSLRG